jgi:hypothetical protein
VIRNWPRVARLESWVRLVLPWTRAGEMNRMISLVAGHYQVSMGEAFDLMYARATHRERKLLAPYRPEGDPQ